MRAETTFDRRITKDDFLQMPMLIPPLGVQRSIAAYLDAETDRIDALIKRRHQIVDLLSERRSLTTDRVLADQASNAGEEWPIIS